MSNSVASLEFRLSKAVDKYSFSNIDPTYEKKVVRKLDYCQIPLMTMFYFLSFLVRIVDASLNPILMSETGPRKNRYIVDVTVCSTSLKNQIQETLASPASRQTCSSQTFDIRSALQFSMCKWYELLGVRCITSDIVGRTSARSFRLICCCAKLGPT